MKKKGITWSKWKVARTIWPFPEGHGVFRENYFTGEKIILDTGISKESAEQIAKDLNNGRTTDNIQNS